MSDEIDETAADAVLQAQARDIQALRDENAALRGETEGLRATAEVVERAGEAMKANQWPDIGWHDSRGLFSVRDGDDESTYPTLLEALTALAGEKPRMSGTTGTRAITAERLKQVEIWGDAHDDEEHEPGDLVMAAVCFALYYIMNLIPPRTDQWNRYEEITESDWPWSEKYWNPKSADHDLPKIGAWIAAEIDKRERLTALAGEAEV